MSADHLEKFIKMNAPFVNEQYKAVVGIMVLHNILFNDLENHLSQYDLTYQQFNILRILKGQHPKGVQLNVIRERMLHKQSDVSRLVDRLVSFGLVNKEPDAENRRKLYIHLTPLGWDLIESIAMDDAGFKSLAMALNDEEIQDFNYLLGKMIASLGPSDL